MSHTYIASCTNSSKDDDTLIIIVNSDGTLSVDPETLQKLLANQHHNSPISLVRLDAKGDGSGEPDGTGDDDDDPDSRVNLTVEGYYPPTPAPSSPTPPPTPVPDSGITADGSNPEILADSITEILQPEDVEKLETALQSEHAKEILGDVVLDMLQNGEDSVGGMGDGGAMAQGSVVLDHCYASLTGPVPSPVTQPHTVPHQPAPATTPVRTAVRGRGRGRGQAQDKAMQSLVPVVEQLVLPSASVGSSPAAKGQPTVAIQGINLQQMSTMNCTVMLRKVPVQQSKPIIVSSHPQEAVGVTNVKSTSEGDVIATKRKGAGRGRGGVTVRGGATVRGGRGAAGRGRGVAKMLNQQEEAKHKQLEEEMAATVHALTLAEAEQFANIESMDQSNVEDSDRVIPLVNKVPAKKPVKVYRRAVDSTGGGAATTPKTIKVLKPDKTTAQPKPRKKSVSVESASLDDKLVGEQKVRREEKVIVVSVEPQITPAVVSAVVMAQSPPTTTAPATAAPTTATHATPAAVGAKKYPKRENRKPPAHLAEAFGPALFSTPDIIRRVSDKSAPSTPVTPNTPATPATVLPAAPVSATPTTGATKLEGELGLLETISSQAAQEQQLLEEALMLEELSTLPTETDVLQQEEVAAPQPLPEPPTPPTTPAVVKKQTSKNLSQTSLSAFFPKVNQKDEVEGESGSQVVTPSIRKLPPVELPATRGATKRATQPTQDPQTSKAEAVKKVASSVEKRKSTDSRKSVDSKKSAGREDADDSLVSDEISDEEGSHNSEDDPNRLWCICRKPHNNRFMICCDFCEDWFHGKCVGITKAMGEQMEEKEIEWMCPNCKKKKKQEEAAAKKQQVEASKTPGPATNKKTPPLAAPAPTEAVAETPPQPQREKKTEASKVIVQQQKLVVLGQETPKSSNKGTEIRITKVSNRKSIDDKRAAAAAADDATDTATGDHHTPDAEKCIVCKKESFPGGVYCSDECIAKHASESLSVLDKSSVIVFEKKTGRIFGGPNGPTPSTLTSWLMAHPSYEVMRPGVLPSAKYYGQPRSGPGPTSQPRPAPALKQTTLQGQARPHGIQLIAALPQPPPVEGPMKKNVQKSEPPTPIATPKAKPQTVAKGQQQITTLLRVQQAKQEAAETNKVNTVKAQQVTPPVKKQKIQEPPKKTTPQAPPKKTTPTVTKKTPKEEDKVKEEDTKVRSKEQEEVNVRASVKKTLQDILTARLQDVDDIKLSEDQIRKITTQIEEELHALFKDTNAKYKAKYRSLIFNIKDKNNLTLFRKIVDKSISPEQLVRLSPEELASQELAQWREREARHQLEMIKKTELDLMQQAKTVVMKTHKGEQVVENEDGLGAKVLETSVEIEPVTITPVTPPVDVPVLKSKEDKEVKHGKKDKDKKEEKQKERRHSSHHKEKSHHKDHKSRSRHRSRLRSESDRRSKSRSPSDVNKSKEKTGLKQEDVKEKDSGRKSRSRHQHHERERSKSRHRERSKSRPRERSKSRPRGRSKSRARERSKSSPRERSKSKVRERSKSRPRERSKSRPRERSKSRPRERSKSRPRERSKSKPRERSKSINRERSKSQDRSRSKSRSKSETRSRSKSRPRERSKTSNSRTCKLSQESDLNKSSLDEKKDEHFITEKVDEEMELPSVEPTVIDAEVKGIIRDLVVEEETGLNEDDLSDREPSSTVNISTPPYNTFEEEEPTKPPVWRGTLIMPDVAKFSTSIQEVSGICEDLAYDLPDTIDCVGRISPETAWDYIAKMKKSGTKQILVVRFAADNEEDKMSYLSFYSYLSSRNRLGVVGNNSKMIKDFYILPLPSHSPVPQVLLPLDGPGFEDYRPHLLLGIIVRTRRKRLMTDKEIPFVPKVAKKSERSYTPPLPEEGGLTPPTTQHQHPVTESFTPPHSPKPPRIIKLKPSSSPTDFVLEDGDTPYTPEDDADAPYSPGDGDGEKEDCSEELQRKVDKLNRMINDIEERKQKIDSGIITGIASPQELVLDAVTEVVEAEVEEVEEAYSPSGSITPPPPDSSYLDKGSGGVCLPSDLQQIIASLKKKPDLQSDPIVQAYRSTDEPYSPEDEKADQEPEAEEKPASPASEESFSTQSSAPSATTAVKVNRDPRQRPQLSLSQLSDEEIMKKASEMGFMNPENPEPIPDVLKSRVEPTPGLIDEQMMHQPPPGFIKQQYSSSQPPFGPEFPPAHPPTHLPPPTFPPPGQFPPPHMYRPAPPPLPPLPPSHIPFTNPQPPPPQPVYPPPPQQPAPLPPPPPKSPDLTLSRKKFSKKKKKSKELRSRKDKKEKRKYSESPPPKDYDYDEREKIRDRDRYSSKKREKRETWRTYEKSPPPEKRRDSWEYEAPPPTFSEPPPPIIPGPSNHPFVPGPMRGMPMRGRFQRGMRGVFRRGFDRGPMRGGFHRGGFHQRGHPHMGGPPPGPPRNFQPKNIQSEYEEDIRRFEEQRKQKNLERRRWRNESPPSRKRRGKESDSD